jgi:lipooligosaccharide transport system permease protein
MVIFMAFHVYNSRSEWQSLFTRSPLKNPFLLSATFFPLDTYPEPAQWLVQITPLYHGVALMRELMLGSVGLGALVHIGYLVLMGLVGVYFAARRVERLLLR